MPRDVVMKINTEIQGILGDPALQKSSWLRRCSRDSMTSTPGGIRPIYQVGDTALGQCDPRAEAHHSVDIA